MNKKLFIKRLGISLLRVLGPVTALCLFLIICFLAEYLFGFAGLSFVVIVSFAVATYPIYEDDIKQYINWLKGNDGQPD